MRAARALDAMPPDKIGGSHGDWLFAVRATPDPVFPVKPSASFGAYVQTLEAYLGFQ